MKEQALATLFDQIADILEFRQENLFRVRAYRRAAESLASLTEDIERLDQEGRLREIPGIGQELANKIHEYLQKGSVRELDEVKRSVPAGVMALLEVPGVGPKTAKVLHERLRIGSIDQLERAARAHKICHLSGFQETKEQNILKGISIVRKGRERMHLGLAFPLARTVLDMLRDMPEVLRAEPAGSLRRMRETVGDLDLLVSTRKPAKVMQAFTKAKYCARVLASGQTKSSILTHEGYQLDLRAVAPDSFGAAWQYFTGSKEHNVRLREMAGRKGLKINEYGVFRLSTGKRVAGREEADVYKAMGLPWIPPEIREDHGEIEAALERRLPKLVDEKDLRGDFHIHTNWSDGNNTLDQVAEAGRKRGYQYLAICDHSQSLKVANGLSPARLKQQMALIRAFNARSKGFQLLMGAEVDILNRGVMDFPDELLKQLDFVVGSIHTGFTQDEATLTNRMIKAMENPYVTLIAHPTGRLMGQRDPYPLNLDAVLDAAKRTGTAMEINAYPKRLDLNDASARRAKERGVRLAVSTDTHSLDQLDHISIGVGVARRAWVERSELLNCLARDQLLAWIKQKRAHAH